MSVRVHFFPFSPDDPWWWRLYARATRTRYRHVCFEHDGLVYDFHLRGAERGLDVIPADAIEWREPRESIALMLTPMPCPIRAWRPWFTCAHFVATMLGARIHKVTTDQLYQWCLHRAMPLD